MAPAAPSLRDRLLGRLAATPEITGLLIMLVVLVGFTLLSPAFLTTRNFQNILIITPELGLVTLGLAILIISGEFDLSVGSVFALSPMVTILAITAGLPMMPAVILGLLGAAAVGLANGWITIRFAIPSFITTLGSLFAVRSLTVIISGGFPPPFPEGVPVDVLVANFGFFRASLLWFLGIACVLAVILHRTNVGNWIFATGGQVQAARDMGIPVNKVKIGCFVLCAVLAGFAGIIQTFRIESPLPSAGEGLELQAIAAAVIGGVALAGGVGSVVGALIGTLLIRFIDNGLVMSRIDANWFKFALGVLTVASVILNGAVQRYAVRLRRRA
ncbi:ABC transporter permease [Vineibacter terrae]|uniref:ABC transporter permease n=1 Tax=Vineibacter terrae TaxID=2586908 RepID=UPI002E31282F|nr:ABC transporter permease [Vineibacter terrae]HEX2889250.1 ABC transporter permease [Vineibacter terrae]